MLDRYLAMAFAEELSEPRRLEARQRKRALNDPMPGVLERIVAPQALRGATCVAEITDHRLHYPF